MAKGDAIRLSEELIKLTNLKQITPKVVAKAMQKAEAPREEPIEEELKEEEE